jgi:hypothetical protein
MIGDEDSLLEQEKTVYAHLSMLLQESNAAKKARIREMNNRMGRLRTIKRSERSNVTSNLGEMRESF